MKTRLLCDLLDCGFLDINFLDELLNSYEIELDIEDIKANLSSILKKDLEIDWNKTQNSIKDKDIVSLSKDLQSEDIKIEDLFK